jgi:hypothetical protein
MEHNYVSNPAIAIWYEYIEAGSKEKEVQGLWENMLWTVFPANDSWTTVTKYQQLSTEPDNKVMKIIQYNAGPATMDLLVVELKRLKEDTARTAFDEVAHNQLDDHMAESANPDRTTLFGAVGIGRHVQFYTKVLPRGRLNHLHNQPLHLLNDAASVQEYFNYFKRHVPSTYQPAASASVSYGGASSAQLSMPPSGAASSAQPPVASYGVVSSAQPSVASYGVVSSAQPSVTSVASYGAAAPSAQPSVAAVASYGAAASSAQPSMTPSGTVSSAQQTLLDKDYIEVALIKLGEDIATNVYQFETSAGLVQKTGDQFSEAKHQNGGKCMVYYGVNSRKFYWTWTLDPESEYVKRKDHRRKNR